MVWPITRRPRRDHRKRNGTGPRVEPLEGRALLAVSFVEYPTLPSVSRLTPGPDGALWSTYGTFDTGQYLTGLSRFDLVTHAYTTYEIPGERPYDVTEGPDGALWFLASKVDASTTLNVPLVIGRFDPRTHASSLTPLPADLDGASGIITGPDGGLWFGLTTRDLAVGFGGDLGRFDPRTLTLAEFPVANVDPTGLINGPDGKIYFHYEMPDNASPGVAFPSLTMLGQFDPTTHTASEFMVTPVDGSVNGITAGPDGGVWFVSFGASVGRFDPATHAVEEFPLAATGVSNPRTVDITTGPDGALWFDGDATSTPGTTLGLVGRIDPVTHATALFTAPDTSGEAFGIVTAPDGNLWFTDGSFQQIDRVVIQADRLTATGLPLNLTVAAALNAPVATFTTDHGSLSAADFRAVVDFGDGVSAPGVVTAGAVGVFTIKAAHTYATAGEYTITTTITASGVVPATATARAVVTPPPAVVGLRRTGVGLQPTQVVLTFDRPMNAATAQDLRNYSFVRVGPLGRAARHPRPIAVRSAVYDPAAQAVTLVPERRLSLFGYYRVVARGGVAGGLSDVLGAPLVGTNTGGGAGDYVGVLHGHGPRPAPAHVVASAKVHHRA